MLLKLYKNEDDVTLYWEAWEDEDEITLHFGQLGSPGQTVTLPLNEFEPPETAIKREAKKARDAGFRELKPDELYELIVQFPVTGSAGADDVENAQRVEEVLNECLGWTGNGQCEGHDIGHDVSGTTMNIYCHVVDPQAAAEAIVDELTCSQLLGDAIIAYQERDESFKVLWPEDYSGVFHY